MNMRVERLIACDVGVGVGVAAGGVGVAAGGVGVAGGGVGVDAGMTVVSSVSELLSGLASSELVLTVAVFESVPAAVGVTTTVTVTLASSLTTPRLQ
jgi:hypothetical protein